MLSSLSPKHHSVPRGPSVLSSLGAPFWWIYIFCENPIARFDVIEFVGLSLYLTLSQERGDVSDPVRRIDVSSAQQVETNQVQTTLFQLLVQMRHQGQE
jgi:hypothetical protein